MNLKSNIWIATYVSEGPGWGMFHPQLYDGDDFLI